MDLRLDALSGAGYTSMSQWARKVTEAWATANLYCVGCPSAQVTAHRNNWKVEDFHCAACRRRLQLKAKSGRIGGTITNSAYAPKMAAILSNNAPDYAFLGYDREAMEVRDLFVVPGHFITPSVVSRRKPLRASAQRQGWVGSVIHLGLVPEAGKVRLVRDGVAIAPRNVRRAFEATAFLGRMPSEARGWLADVLACIDRLAMPAGEPFHLDDVYAFERHLQALHPRNRNVRPKIRQQVQVLRDKGVLEALGKGRYAKATLTSR